MEIHLLKAERRTATGTSAAWRLRREGRLPAVIYGEGGESLPITVDLHEMEGLLRHHERVVELQVKGGHKEKALLHEVQWDAMGDHLVHADFLRISHHAQVEVDVPIEFVGHAKGIAHGGDLRKVVNDLPVTCAPETIPEAIPVVVNELDVGDAIYVRDLELPAGVVCRLEPDAVICSVGAAEEEAEEEAEAGTEEGAAAEPEVIGRGRSSEEDGDQG